MKTSTYECILDSIPWGSQGPVIRLIKPAFPFYAFLGRNCINNPSIHPYTQRRLLRENVIAVSYLFIWCQVLGWEVRWIVLQEFRVGSFDCLDINLLPLPLRLASQGLVWCGAMAVTFQGLRTHNYIGT